MKVNIDYLKKFINLTQQPVELKEIFASIGMEVGEITDQDGTAVFEIEITPNRPDWLSHYGIARDLHARLPELTLRPISFRERKLESHLESFSLLIDDKNDCSRYTGCIVRDLTVGESSPEVKILLESLGLRPINNIVDISNLMVITVGHPIHMFDLDKLQGKEIQVRRARPGEKILLLDGQEVELDHDFLVIADSQVPVALAGIMGGELTGVTGSTRNILIESAYFNPVLIRRAARKLGIKSDASYRFERGADIQITPTAIRIALDMIADFIGEDLSVTYYQDLFPAGFTPKVVELNKQYPAAYSGIKIEPEVSGKILADLGFKLQDKDDSWLVEVPSFRVDIYGKQDLVEEIIRIHGYDKLTSEIPLTSNTVFRIDTDREFLQKIRAHLTSLGFFEALNYIFNSPEEFNFFAANEKAIEIRNPLGKDFSLLRKSLLPGLMRGAALNFNHAVSGIGLFEFGNHFLLEQNDIRERATLAILGSGEYRQSNWKDRVPVAYDFFLFKSLLVSLFTKLSLGFNLKKEGYPFFDPACSFSVWSGDIKIGTMGRLAKEIEEWFKLEKPVFATELNLAKMMDGLEEKSFRMWSRYPSYRRDFSFLMSRDIHYEKLEEAIRELKPEILVDVNVFDRFQGEGIPRGKVSLSLSFIYSHNAKTLTNEEINDMHQHFINRLIEKFDLVQR